MEEDCKEEGIQGSEKIRHYMSKREGAREGRGDTEEADRGVFSRDEGESQGGGGKAQKGETRKDTKRLD